jgi:hypothetical protein
MHSFDEGSDRHSKEDSDLGRWVNENLVDMAPDEDSSDEE